MTFPRLFLLCLTGVILASCNMTPTQQAFPPISFRDSTPIVLNVLTVDVVQEYKPPLAPPNVEHLFPITPAQAMRQWVKDRIKAVGGDHRLEVIIKDASVVENRLALTPGLKGAFTNEQEARYDGRMAVELRIYGERIVSEANIEVTANRSRTIDERSSVTQRDRIYYQMTRQMMQDMNAELEKNIYQYFRNYVRYDPSL